MLYSKIKQYHTNLRYRDRQACAKCVDLGQTPQKAASDQYQLFSTHPAECRLQQVGSKMDFICSNYKITVVKS